MRAGHYSEEKPFWATLKQSRLLTSADCGKHVIHMVFDVADAGLQFAAGDAFTVRPSNDPKLVTQLLEHLDEDSSQCALAFCPRCTYSHVRLLELAWATPPRPTSLRLAALYFLK
jgi:sulfite reductase alpha subunit-like flavoprotein